MKHFITVVVSATGQKSSWLSAVECFGTGMMEVVLKHMGTAAWVSDRFEISVSILVRCPAQDLSMGPGMPSGPAGGLTCINPAQCNTHIN